jgi:hypothetical protein
VFSLTLVVLQYAVHEPARVVVTPAVFTSSECESLLAVAKNEGAWSKKRHRYAATDDFLIHTIAALKNVTEAFESRVLPLVRKLHGVPDGVEVSVKELYVIRYLIRSESQRGLDSHIDGSTLSASIALSDPSSDFSGAGLLFDLMPPSSTTVLRVNKGAMVSHPSKLIHAGLPIEGGERFVLVGFLSVAKNAELYLGGAVTGRPATEAVSATRHGMFARCADLVRHDLEPPVSSGPHCVSLPAAVYRQVKVRVDTLWRDDQDRRDTQVVLFLNAIVGIYTILYYGRYLD